MFMLLIVTLFVIMLLVSLERHGAGTRDFAHRLTRRVLGTVSLLAGAGLAITLTSGLASGVTGSMESSPWLAVWGPRCVRAAEESGDFAQEGSEAGTESPANGVGVEDAIGSEGTAASEDVEASSAMEETSQDEQSEESSSEAVSTSSPNTLSVEPLQDLPRVVIPWENRPEWVEMEPDMSGDVHRVAVTAGPFERKSDCLTQLDVEKQKAVARYVDEYLKSPQASVFIRYDLDYIDRHLVRDDPTSQHEEVIEVSLGPMHQVHALLEFDEDFRRELDEDWRDVQAGVRLSQTGLGAFGILALLGVAFTYFRLDTATRGYYSTKLQILAALAILALIATGVLLAGWIPRL